MVRPLPHRRLVDHTADDVLPDQDGVDLVLGQRVEDLLGLQAPLQQHQALGAAPVVQALDGLALVQPLVLAVLQAGTLGVGRQPVAQASAAVVGQHDLQRLDRVARHAPQTIQAASGIALALD
ncbi:hypothetical protein D3C84_1080050 [compost metagenome]